MLIVDLLGKIEEKLPASSAMTGDRIGLQIDCSQADIRKILVTLELDDQVVDEAVRKKYDCIITFHPLIYNPLNCIVSSDRVGRITQKLIKNSISLICIHTNFDAFARGTSQILAARLGLECVGFLRPDDSISNCGMGVLAETPRPMTATELLGLVGRVCRSPLRWSEGSQARIRKIAILGGSGFSFLDDALDAGADAFITADVTYHRFHEAARRIMLIDPGHYEMEKFVPAGLARLLEETLNPEEYESIDISGIVTNPVNYFMPAVEANEQEMNSIINNNKKIG